MKTRYISNAVGLTSGIILLILVSCSRKSTQQLTLDYYIDQWTDETEEFYNNLVGIENCKSSQTLQVNIKLLTESEAPALTSDFEHVLPSTITDLDSSSILRIDKSSTSMAQLLSDIRTEVCKKSHLDIVYKTSSDDKTLPIDQIPTLNPVILDELAIATFWKFAEGQNLLANEKNSKITDHLIDNMMRLFVSDEIVVEIQNRQDLHITSMDVKKYLHRMTKLNRYDGIEISWNNDLKMMQPWDSKPGTELQESQSFITGQQKFFGFKKGQILYSDSVDKTIDLHARLVEKVDITGNITLEWEVLLGDIRIADRPTHIHTSV